MHKSSFAGLSLASALAFAVGSAQASAEERMPADDLSGLAAVSSETLGKSNGREGLSLNNADINNTSSLNQANGAISGNASLGDGAISNVNGIAAVVVNSGQNAVVQVSQQVIFNLH